MFLLGKLHHQVVFQRRIQALVNAIAPLFETGDVLDVGSGNGMLAQLIMQQRPELNISGIDVHLREKSFIPTTKYDGQTIPFPDASFSSVMIVDVLHHTDNPVHVLRECLRVSRGVVVVKDHFYANPVERQLLRLLDWVGNAPHGVRLPYNYFTRAEWASYMTSCGCRELKRMDSVPNMYPPLFQQIIGQRIQFVAQLGKLP